MEVWCGEVGNMHVHLSVRWLGELVMLEYE